MWTQYVVHITLTFTRTSQEKGNVKVKKKKKVKGKIIKAKSAMLRFNNENLEYCDAVCHDFAVLKKMEAEY